MLYPRNENVLKECPKGPQSVVISERLTTGFPITTPLTGVVKLRQRIDDVVAFRVLHCKFTRDGATSSGTNGSMLTIGGNTLGAKLARNPFQLALSTDTGVSEGIAYSNIIGFGTTTNSNISWEFDDGEFNRKQYFTSAYSIESFDWQVTTLRGTPNIIGACTVELVIQFFSQCRCDAS